MEPYRKRALKFSPLSVWNPYAEDMDMDPLRIEAYKARTRRNLESTIGTADLERLKATNTRRNLERAPWLWKTSYEQDRIIEYKVLKDGRRRVLAYYIPYSLNAKEWGIYLLKDEILPDIDYLNWLMKRRGIPVDVSSVYVSLIFLHELTHHVIEDWRTSSGVFSYVQDDEMLCEYTAFTLTQALFSRLNGNIDPRRSGAGKDQYFVGYPVPGFLLQFPGLPKEVHFNYYDLISLLISIYYYWGRDTDRVYKLQVPSWVNEEDFVKFLSQNLNLGLEEMWSGRPTLSVYKRVRIV